MIYIQIAPCGLALKREAVLICKITYKSRRKEALLMQSNSCKMSIRDEKITFDSEVSKRVFESTLVKFNGIDGWDAYNSSIPFEVDGKRYIFARIEKRDEWATSVSKLFYEVARDEWSLLPYAETYPLEDPFVAKVGGEIVLGGTHVRKIGGSPEVYCCYFYKGTLDKMTYFTTGPAGMKDIRLVELSEGRIGVFSRPRRPCANGAQSAVGFTVIDDIMKLTPELVESAPYINGLFGAGEWGGVNQAYLLESGKIGGIGHTSWVERRGELDFQIYTNTAFVLDPETLELLDYKMIGTSAAYPATEPKKPHLADCVFTSGIEMRADGKVDLYSGVRDAYVGRITIDYPFEGFGKIITKTAI